MKARIESLLKVRDTDDPKEAERNLLRGIARGSYIAQPNKDLRGRPSIALTDDGKAPKGQGGKVLALPRSIATDKKAGPSTAHRADVAMGEALRAGSMSALFGNANQVSPDSSEVTGYVQITAAEIADSTEPFNPRTADRTRKAATEAIKAAYIAGVIRKTETETVQTAPGTSGYFGKARAYRDRTTGIGHKAAAALTEGSYKTLPDALDALGKVAHYNLTHYDRPIDAGRFTEAIQSIAQRIDAMTPAKKRFSGDVNEGHFNPSTIAEAVAQAFKRFAEGFTPDPEPEPETEPEESEEGEPGDDSEGDDNSSGEESESEGESEEENDKDNASVERENPADAPEDEEGDSTSDDTTDAPAGDQDGKEDTSGKEDESDTDEETEGEEQSEDDSSGDEDGSGSDPDEESEDEGEEGDEETDRDKLGDTAEGTNDDTADETGDEDGEDTGDEDEEGEDEESNMGIGSIPAPADFDPTAEFSSLAETDHPSGDPITADIAPNAEPLTGTEMIWRNYRFKKPFKLSSATKYTGEGECFTDPIAYTHALMGKRYSTGIITLDDFRAAQAETYKNVSQSVRGLTAKVKDALALLQPNVSRKYIGGYRQGVLNQTALHKLYTEPAPRVAMQRAAPRQRKLAILLLLDASGSMSSGTGRGRDRSTEVRDVTTALIQAVRDNPDITCSVVSYQDRHACMLYGPGSSKPDDPSALATYAPGAGNSDARAVQFAESYMAEYMPANQYDYRLCFWLHDGELCNWLPYHSSMGYGETPTPEGRIENYTQDEKGDPASLATLAIINGTAQRMLDQGIELFGYGIYEPYSKEVGETILPNSRAKPVGDAAAAITAIVQTLKRISQS